MKLGVFISKRQSFEGGGYTITEELFNSLINEIDLKELMENSFLISNDFDNSISNKLIKKN